MQDHMFVHNTFFIASDIVNVRPPYSTINTLTGINNRHIISTIVGCIIANSG